MKKLLSLFILFLISFNAFSYGKYLSGAKGKLNVIKTEYFDIIFPDKSEESALKISAVCDDYYRQLCSLFEYEPYQTFSVVLTDQVEMSNAFFTLAPYNMIVVFDYPVALEINNNKYEIETVFYHELTHAVSLNSKAPGWRLMSFFGQIFTPAGLSLTSFWYEGAAVSVESLEDGGRLNDPYFNQIILDAKFKDVTGVKKFPSWRDVTGARDVYPYGNDAYVFGAHFARYLIETYGFSKYAEFWKNAGTSTNLSFCAGVFKKTYGIALSDAWKSFYEDIELPEIDLEKRKAFVSTSNLISKNGAVTQTADSYFNPQTGKYDLVWFDSLSQGIFFNSKRLFTIKNVESIRFSPDGSKLYVNRLKDKDNVKNVDFIYDLKSKKRSFAEHDSANFEKSHDASFVKEGLTWYLQYEDRKGGQKVRWNLSSRILHHLHFVSEDENSLSFVFTWAELFTKTMARAGLVKIDKNTLEAKILLEKNDNYTGLIETLACDGEYEFYVISEEYDSRPLRKLKLTEDDFEVFEAEKTVLSEDGEHSKIEAAPEVKPEESSENKISFKAEYASYNPFKYYVHGIILPFGTAGEYNHDLEEESVCFYGASFISSNPWLDKLIQLSFGLDAVTMSGGALLGFSGGDDSFAYSLSGTAIFDRNGFKQTFDSASVSKVLWQGDYASLSFEAAGNLLYGKDGLETEYKAKDKLDPSKKITVTSLRKGLTARGVPDLLFSAVHRVRPGYNQTAGFYLQPFGDFEYQKYKTFWEDDFKPEEETSSVYYNAGGTLGLVFPGLFPANLAFSLFPQKGYFVSAQSKIMLYDLELHKGIPAVSLYAQRLVFNLLYTGWFEYINQEKWDIKRTREIFDGLEKDDWEDYLRLAAEIQLSLNTSYFASSGAAGIGGYLQYNLHGEDKNTWKAGLYVNVAW